eukprot:gnl/TRDRNA2_/TRDRNA2_195482_c0_seq1.p1 gnl/TRDRNA2_/TRDRNA2_195482_c0~~gnl/TRDRNA2_/TRDRNA2_195482_c0_seq1.p1  ORF type:complete len:197 (+),score=49.40 gnl/TRDRNA2_/TRDRNA2_195482_c0_seq1:44-592(+)
MVDVVTMSESLGSLIRQLEKLECDLMEKDRENAARILAANKRADDASVHLGEVDRQLERERRDARLAAKHKKNDLEAQGLAAVRKAEQELDAEKRALKIAEAALADARWRQAAAQRQADDLATHAISMEQSADVDLAATAAACARRVELVKQDGRQRAQDAKEFQEAMSPYLEAMKVRPGTR